MFKLTSQCVKPIQRRVIQRETLTKQLHGAHQDAFIQTVLRCHLSPPMAKPPETYGFLG
jgi:hypothetical protein